jgi:hypothetical protein
MHGHDFILAWDHVPLGIFVVTACLRKLIAANYSAASAKSSYLCCIIDNSMISLLCSRLKSYIRVKYCTCLICNAVYMHDRYTPPFHITSHIMFGHNKIYNI